MSYLFVNHPGMQKKILLENEGSITKFLAEKLMESEKLILSPYKSIVIERNDKKIPITLFIVEPTLLAPFNTKVHLSLASGYHKEYINLDSLFQIMNNFSLFVFEKMDVSQITKEVVFSSPVSFEVVIPTDEQYVHERKRGERCAGDEFDGEFHYDYYERNFPIISSDNKITQRSFPIDGCYFDKYNNGNRIKEGQKFLVWSYTDTLIKMS